MSEVVSAEDRALEYVRYLLNAKGNIQIAVVKNKHGISVVKNGKGYAEQTFSGNTRSA